MGLRYRKRIKLAPGVRLNVSKSGFSWTLGPRGASLGISSRGVYRNLGIPGSGLYMRDRIDRSPSRARSSSNYTSMSIAVGVRDDGEVYFQDADGNPLSDRFVRAAKRQHGDRIRSLIEEKCEEINQQIEALGEVHLKTPDPTKPPVYEPKSFEFDPPKKPAPRSLGILGRLFKSVRRNIEAENAKAAATFAAAMKEWQQDKAAFEDGERERKALIEQGIYRDPLAMERFFETRLNGIQWPRETAVDFEIANDGKKAFLDVDLPEVEDIPTKTASAPQRGYKLTVRELSATNIQQLYMRHVHGIGFRLIGEAFAALPLLQEAVVSAYSQRADKATGTVGDEYLYSARVNRSAWERINFANLEAIDIVAALEQFDLRRDMTKTGVLKPIQPFAPEN